MESNSVQVHGLAAFTLAPFSSSQETDHEKSGYESVVSSASCFGEVVQSQEDISRSVQIVEGVPYDSSTMVTSVCQDSLLQSTHVSMTVPESTLFDVVQSHVIPSQVAVHTVGDASMADNGNICDDKTDTHHQMQELVEPQIQTIAEPKKRKGGWPKGKKRKKEYDLNKPKAPVTGYVRFLNSRRESVKHQHPHLTFPEITKMLGQEWNSLLPEEKQKFLDEAEEDKKRYVEELRAYQQSEQYQAFVKRQHVKRTKHPAANEPMEGDLDAHSSIFMQQAEDSDSSDLFCKTCNQYFSSLHNKREHMYGRQHLQMLTCEFEREAEKSASSGTAVSLTTPQAAPAVQGPPVTVATTQNSFQSTELSIPQFTEGFLEQNLNRELEIRELRKSVLTSQEQNLLLAKEIEDLKVLLQKVESEMTTAKAFGASLTAQLNSLRMVPTLFGVQLQINFN
ncbi:high mobility group protein 20A [Nematostella vectensis]|uniref:high mobility group protein 20A n=1 Tax=Nematostella vectensis TaxID=45351 RepID=UPI002076F8B5|nr:high mobility group protein 20A [Nematostella vectensis]